MRFIPREVTSNQPHPSSNDAANYYAEYQPAASTELLKKGFPSLEWVSMIIKPSTYGYKQLTSYTVLQEPADKGHRSLLSHVFNLKHLKSRPVRVESKLLMQTTHKIRHICDHDVRICTCSRWNHSNSNLTFYINVPPRLLRPECCKNEICQCMTLQLPVLSTRTVKVFRATTTRLTKIWRSTDVLVLPTYLSFVYAKFAGFGSVTKYSYTARKDDLGKKWGKTAVSVRRQKIKN